MLTKVAFVVMFSFILSIILGFILIPFLRKKKLDQVLNRYLEQTHKKKSGTPTMGGIIFIIPAVLIILFLLILNIVELNYSLIIVLFTFLSYSFIGFIDDYLIIIKNSNNGLSEGTKFVLQLFVAVIFFYLFMKAGNEPLLWIHTLNLRLDIGWYYIEYDTSHGKKRGYVSAKYVQLI